MDDRFERLDQEQPAASAEMEVIDLPQSDIPEASEPADAPGTPAEEAPPAEEGPAQPAEASCEAAPAAGEAAPAVDDWMAELDKEVATAAKTVNKEALSEKEKKAAELPKKATKSAPTPPPPPPVEKFRYPFNVRYGAEVIQVAGFVDGEEYTADQITEMLIANGYTEFRDIKPSYHFNAATGMLIITIQGSRKGA